jgi:hypothetical protein
MGTDMTKTVAGVEFQVEDIHTLTYFSFGDDALDVMLSQQDLHSWDVYIHDGVNGDLIEQHTFATEEQCVMWAQAKGYLPRS